MAGPRKKRKGPLLAASPPPTRGGPWVEAPLDNLRQQPVWRIHLLELKGPYGWHQLDAQTLKDVHEKLRHFENMTWGEILVDANKQNHRVSVENLAKSARDRLEEIGQSDVDELISLRLTARKRLWGILDNHVLSLLWWDPEHQICPSLKKHT